MGQIFCSHANDCTSMDPEIQSDMYNINIANVIEIADLINQIVFDKDHQNYDEFEDIFTLCLNCTDKIFHQLKERQNNTDVVSIYEAITVLTFLCQDSYEKKITYLFSIFDFDKNFELNKSEFELTIGTLTKGLAKLVGCYCPDENDIAIFSNKVFMMADTDFSYSIESHELSEYIKNDWVVQDFQLKYTHSTSYSNAHRRFNIQLDKGAHAWNMYTHTFENKDQMLKDQFMLMFDLKNPKDQEWLLDLAKKHEKDAEISKEVYDDLIKAISAYKALDIEHCGHINKSNYYLMIWLYTEMEPDDSKVKIGQSKLDGDNNGNIELMEWIVYLCITDTQGDVYFMGSLRKRFIDIDKDHSGRLELMELKMVQTQTMIDWAESLGRSEEQINEMKTKIAPTVTGIVKEVLRDVKKNDIGWDDFQQFLLSSELRIEELKRFILDSYLNKQHSQNEIQDGKH